MGVQVEPAVSEPAALEVGVVAQIELTLIIARLAQRLDVVAERTEKPKPLGMVVNRPAAAFPCTYVRGPERGRVDAVAGDGGGPR